LPAKRKQQHHSLRSLPGCLLTLGAKPQDVSHKHRGPCMSVSALRYNQVRGQRYDSIYERYTTDELRAWAKSLYRAAIKQSHPDKGGSNRQARRLAEAYKRAQRILRYR